MNTMTSLSTLSKNDLREQHCPSEKFALIGEELYEVLHAFAPITLQEMKKVKLMNRIDTKYVIAAQRLKRILADLTERYRLQVQEGDVRLAPYSTLYFDSPQTDFYIMHHNQRAARQKIRIRSYDNSQQHFLEVKNKNNKGRTKKVRRAIPEIPPENGINTLNQEAQDFIISKGCKIDATQLLPWLENHFRRITLVNDQMTERLTIDIGLQVCNRQTGQTADLGDFVIIELKRDGNYPSHAASTLFRHRIRKCGFSKYCIGMLLTTPGIKSNRFKEKLRRLEKIKYNNDKDFVHYCDG